METLRITKADLNEYNEYAASRDLDFDGHIEIAASLGCVKVRGFISAAGCLGIKAGSGIEAGFGIEAGLGIKAGSGIKAGWGIEAGLQITAKMITAKLRIFAGICIWKIPSSTEMTISAQRVEGTVSFGDVKLLPSETPSATPKA